MAKLAFRLVMPERELTSVDADMVVVPGSEGDMGVLHGHAPVITTLRPGVLEVFQGSKAEQRYLVAGGFAEITPERCTVLAEEAVPFETVTVDALVEREKIAERALADASSEAERQAAEKAIAVAGDLRRAQAYYATR
jgi:F-type H+-transporting ATPase subunit epsilon